MPVTERDTNKMGRLHRRLWIVMLCAVVIVMVAACTDDGSNLPVDSGDTAAAGADVAAGDSGDGGNEADTGGQPSDAPGDGAVEAGPYDYCNATPPDSECFALRRDPTSPQIALARAIADKQVNGRSPESLAWDWGEAVLMLGLVQLFRVTGDTAYQDYYRAYIDHHIENGYLVEASDSSAPAAIALALYAETGLEVYRTVVLEVLDYLYNNAERIPEGGISHFGGLEGFEISIWADSLFMFGNVFTGWGELADDAEALDEFAAQATIFAELLQEEPGWFRHAAQSRLPQTEDVYWARANGWIAVALYDHLRVRLNRGEEMPDMLASAGRLTSAIVSAQDETGLWWTVVNRPGETYLETSASALFTFALARAYRYGLLDADILPVIEAGVAGVTSQITDDEMGQPVITNISGPTIVGSFNYYSNVRVDDDIPYGVGATLLALTEASGLIEQ